MSCHICDSYWNKAKKDKTEAPIKEPTRGAEAPLLGPGPGDGAGASAAATAALMEAAAMRRAQVTFFMSMTSKMCDLFWRPAGVLMIQVCVCVLFLLSLLAGLRYNGGLLHGL